MTCPAKINLFLSVGPKDSTGYHPIRSVFQAVNICDTLEMETSEADGFSCSENIDLPEDNTVTKAWRLAREYVDLPKLKVNLTKRIPSQSGFGGGSSDAAGFLRGLVKITNGKFGMNEAEEVARAVGSDVPFFLVGGMARAEGYGEIVTPLPESPTRQLVFIMPNCTVSTPCAYNELDKKPRALRPFPEDPFTPDNDFLEVAPKESTEALKLIMGWGASTGGLTGSGAAVFGFFPSESHANLTVFSAVERGLTVNSYAGACRTMTHKESLWIS